MASSPVTFSLDADGLGWIVLDAPGSRGNVLNAATLDALAAALDAAEASSARAWVLASGKERIFVAGADLRALQNLPDEPTAAAFSRRGQLLLQRIAEAPVPVVAAIHGACAGGGLELALACDWRVASDAPVTRIGFPEISIGTLPGWGGCVRLPRLLGAQAAIECILRSQLVDAVSALKSGLVDELAHPAELRQRARQRALELAVAGKPCRTVSDSVAREYWTELRRATAARTRGQPAPLAAIDAVQEGIGQPIDAALAIEARHFGRVTSGAVCRNMIYAFLLREGARKRTLDGWLTDREETAGEAPPVHRVGVVGAGVMGAGIAHWLATRGFDVVLRDVRLEFVERAMGVIRALIDDGVKRGQVPAQDRGTVYGRIRTTTTWDGFAECDLVIEAIVEDLAAKRRLFTELAEVVRRDALLASNTSALPIEELAGHVPEPGRTLGLHFFNPVSRMPLVELVIGERTTPCAAARVLEFARTLGKLPVICRSSPGFLVTRVLFFYLNAAVRRWEAGVPAAQIDRALQDFGWPMGPMRLIDEVGLDVTAFIFGEMARYFPGRFASSTACSRLLAGGLKGRKNGAGRGFYRYAGREEEVNETEARTLASGGGAPTPDTSDDQLLRELMDVMVGEARRCLAERVVLSPEDIDFALLTGAGFPAFRGGLLRWADSTPR